MRVDNGMEKEKKRKSLDQQGRKAAGFSKKEGGTSLWQDQSYLTRKGREDSGGKTRMAPLVRGSLRERRPPACQGTIRKGECGKKKEHMA